MSKIADKIRQGEAKIKEKYDIFIERPRLNPLIKLFYLIIKNFQLLIRNKLSSLVFIFGPLLIIFLVALFFNNSTLYDLNIATYSESYSTIADGIVNNLSDSQYNVLKMGSEEECIDAIKFDDFQVCLIFPSNMILDNSANNIITIYVDNSRINLANLISNQISSKVSIEASELSESMVTQILTVLDTVNTETVQAQATVDNLQTYNNQLQSSASSAGSAADDLDLSYTTVDTTAIDTEISSIQGANNISLSTLSTLIDSLQSSYTSMAAKMSSASSSVDTVNTQLSSINTNLDNEATKIASIDTSLTDIQTQIDTIKITNVDNIISPIKTSIEPISSSNSYLLYILPSILVLLVMLVSLLMSSSAIISERTSTAHFRNYITPTNIILPLLGEFITNLIVLTFQIGAMLTVLYFFFNDISWLIFLYSSIVLILIAAVFILIGMIIGYTFNTKQSVTLSAISLGVILLFFSNTILPLEVMSSMVRKVLFYNPFVMGESILKKLLLFSSTLGEISFYIYILLGLIAIAFIGAILAMELSKNSQI